MLYQAVQRSLDSLHLSSSYIWPILDKLVLYEEKDKRGSKAYSLILNMLN